MEIIGRIEGVIASATDDRLKGIMALSVLNGESCGRLEYRSARNLLHCIV